MRTVAFDPTSLSEPSSLEWWAAWQKRADNATDQVLKRWVDWYSQLPGADGSRAVPFDPKLQQKIWSDLKEWLNEHVYHCRCAYCEGPIDSDRYEGDAEHFRPKGRVTVRDVAGRPSIARCRLPDGSEINHPGYFWLAYDWRNLVPACAHCNSGSGKVDQFPVNTQHAFQTDEPTSGFGAAGAPSRIEGLPALESPRSYFLPPSRLDSIESPLLLNPLNPVPDRDPSRHLRYGIGGEVVALDGSQLGNMSIEVYGLKRSALRKRRQEAQEKLQLEYFAAMQTGGLGAVDQADRILEKYRSGRQDFGTAALHCLAEVQKQAARRLQI